MPSITLNLYDTFRRKQASGENGVDLNALTVKLLIVTNSYTPDQNAHDFEDDLGANEVSGTGYTAGGNTMANMVDTLSGAGLVTVGFDDPTTWAEDAAGFSTGRRFIPYIDRGGASSANELIGYTDAAAADFGNTTGALTANLNASGLFQSAR